MKTIKIIDLLNKIAKGETPQKIRYLGTTYIFDEYRGDWGYVDKSTQPYKWFFKEFNCDLETDLNSEAEIIEEEKEIKMCNVLEHCIDFSKNENILLDNQLRLQDKINELIDAINSINKGK